MKRSNRLIALLLTLAMVLALMPTVVFAEGELGDLTGKTVILHTNDVHGAIEGYAKVAALKDQYEAAGADVILVDAGDYSQGTTYVSTTKGANAVTMMNAAGYDFATLGNHEFDYGYAQLQENLESAEFQVLCANVFGDDGETIYAPYALYPNSIALMDEVGVTIGFIGLETPEAQTKANPALIKGLQFAAEDDLYGIANDAAADLEKEGADLVICLSHLGVDDSSEPNRSVDLCKNTEGIDFIIDGHSHTIMTEGKNGEPIQSTGDSFKNVGCIVIDNAKQEIVDNYLIPITDDMPEDPEVAAAAKEIIDDVNAEYGEVFAKTEVDLDGVKDHVRTDDTNLANLITDAILWTATKEEGAIEVDPENIVAITNGGGIRASISAGDITKNDINTVLPFGNTVAVIYVSGAELLEALEASTYASPESLGGFPQVAGIEMSVYNFYTYDKGEQYPGSTYYEPNSIRRVEINSINGEPFDEDATYAVVTNNFVAAGGDTYYVFGSSEQQFDTGIPMDEAVMDYITTALDGVVGEEYAEAENRIDIVGIPYSDVPYGKYYTEAVGDLTYWEAINGFGDGTFRPFNQLTRGQFAAILYRLIGWNIKAEEVEFTPGSEQYSDVPAGAYYDEAVGALTAVDIFAGTGDGKFSPNAPVTREMIAAVLYRAEEKYYPEPDDLDGEPDITTAVDYSSISEYALEAMQWCVDLGVIAGYSSDSLVLKPKAYTTRAEAVTMIYRYMELPVYDNPGELIPVG